MVPEPVKTFFVPPVQAEWDTALNLSNQNVKPKYQSTKNLSIVDKNLDTKNLDAATSIFCLKLSSQNLH